MRDVDAEAGHGLYGERINATRFSAGLGIDISHHTSDTVASFADETIDYVVTVCDHAREHCPYVPARIKNLHMPFPDPTRATGTDEDKLATFISVRTLIQRWLDEWVATTVSA